MIHRPVDIMVFGGGIDQKRNTYLSASSERRAEHAAKIWMTMGREATILCSGGYGMRSVDMTITDNTPSEAELMARIIQERGVPEPQIVCESKSISTVTNFTFSLKNGLLLPIDYSTDTPLHLVTDASHMGRVQLFASILDIPSAAHPTPFIESDACWRRETSLYLAYVARNLDLLTYRKHLPPEDKAKLLESRNLAISRQTQTLDYQQTAQTVAA